MFTVGKDLSLFPTILRQSKTFLLTFKQKIQTFINPSSKQVSNNNKQLAALTIEHLDLFLAPRKVLKSPQHKKAFFKRALLLNILKK